MHRPRAEPSGWWSDWLLLSLEPRARASMKTEVEPLYASPPQPVAMSANWIKEAALMINRLILMAAAKATGDSVPEEDRITDADIDALEAELLAVLAAQATPTTPAAADVMTERERP